MKWYYPLFALALLFFVPSCSTVSTAPTEVVLAHLSDVHVFDHYSNMVNSKLQALSQAGHLKDRDLLQKIKNYHDAIYAFYTKAFILLADGDIKGYNLNLDRCWGLSQALEKIANDILAKVHKEKGQGL